MPPSQGAARHRPVFYPDDWRRNLMRYGRITVETAIYHTCQPSDTVVVATNGKLGIHPPYYLPTRVPYH